MRLELNTQFLNHSGLHLSAEDLALGLSLGIITPTTVIAVVRQHGQDALLDPVLRQLVELDGSAVAEIREILGAVEPEEVTLEPPLSVRKWLYLELLATYELRGQLREPFEFVEQEDCAPGETFISGPYTDACHKTESVEERQRREAAFVAPMVHAWENFGVSISGCLFLCFEAGIGGGFTLGVGVGGKAEVALSAGFGDAPDGGVKKVNCSAGVGPLGGYVEGGHAWGSGKYFTGFGWSGGVGAGCAVMYSYSVNRCRGRPPKRLVRAGWHFAALL